MPTSPPPRPEIVDLDVRPLLSAGQEPFQLIMKTVDALAPGQTLRLLAPFRPVPLFSVMARRGYEASDRALEGGDWEVVFARGRDAEAEAGLSAGLKPEAASWPAAIEELDLRDLQPPDPMVRILEALEELRAGEVLFALLAREPVFLFPELERRGHEWTGNFDASGKDYRLLVRHAAEREPS